MSDPSVAIALPLIKKWEGCVLHPNQDIAGHWQIGWGFCYLKHGMMVTAQTPQMTQEQADALLLQLVETVADTVQAMVVAPLATDNQIAALISFAYNEGVHALKDSTLLDLYNHGYIDLAANQFDAWVYAGGKKVNGLINRRAEEKALFLREDSVASF